jgi:hypothetical protein
MATILAAANGNWSSTATWTGGVIPVAGDVVVANAKTVTIDQDITVLELRTDTTGGGLAGGGFSVNATGRTINANLIAGTTSCLSTTLTPTVSSITINGSITGGTSASAHGFISNAQYPFALNVTGGGTVRASSTGTVTTAHGISLPANASAAWTLNLTCNLQGCNYGHAISVGVTSGQPLQITLNGNITSANRSGASGTGITLSGSGTDFVYSQVGTITNGTISCNLLALSTASFNSGTFAFTGDMYGGTGNNTTALAPNSIVVTTTGNIYSQGLSTVFSAGSGTQCSHIGNIYGAGSTTNATTSSYAYSFSGATLTVTGSVFAGDKGHGVAISSGGTFNIDLARGSNVGPGFVYNLAYALVYLTQAAIVNVNKYEYGDRGMPAANGPVRFTGQTTNYSEVYTINATRKAQVYAESVTAPSEADVRSGVTYSNGTKTGTLAVPSASAVLQGVAVGNTTGTAPLDASTIRSALGMASANLDTQLATIAAATAPSVTAIRAELDTNSVKLANLDATISSRLATGSYTEPPTAAAIATAVWAAATRTLTTAIDNSATIAAAVWSYATGRTITGGTVDTLTNAPSVPSAAAIASQVRTELSTELGRIDATVSSRLAPAGTLARVTLTDTVTTLTNAPTVPSAAAIASQVRTELTPELARVANAATVDNVAAIVEGAQ